MRRSTTLALALALSAFCLQTIQAAEQAPNEWLPKETLVCLEVSRPGALLDLILSDEAAEAATSFPAYEQLAASDGFVQFQGVIRYLEGSLGTDWKSGVRSLLGGGFTFAVTGDERIYLIVESQDEKLLNELHKTVADFSKDGNPDKVTSAEYRGVTGWQFNEGESHAIIGNRLVLSNQREGLKSIVDQREDGGPSLATLPAYQEAMKAAGDDAAATLFVNIGVLKHAPGFAESLATDSNPLGALLFAGISEALLGSNWLTLALNVEGTTLTLEGLVDGKAVETDGAAAFARSDDPDEGAMPNLEVPRMIAGMSFYRDLHGFYAAKDDLFPERTGGLIFFENMMGIFFTGRDLTDEVLAETAPGMRLVAARQEYDPAIGIPKTQFPGFALVLRLKNPERFSVVVEEAWVKFIGLMNFTQGQQAQPGLMFDKNTHNGVRYTVAYYSSADEKDRSAVHSRHNMRPTVAVVGEHLILASTDQLTNDVIDALKKEAADGVGPLADRHSLVDIDTTALSDILEANREAMVRQSMVNDGNTRQEAEVQWDLIYVVLDMLGRVEIELGSQDGRPSATLEIDLNLK